MRQTIVTREYHYTAVFEPAEEGGFVVTFPALRGLVTEGDTLEHARAMAAEALHGFLESLAKDGISAPTEDPQPSMPLIRETITAAI
jgi:predicted RNase H-like HicB family nuclease